MDNERKKCVCAGQHGTEYAGPADWQDLGAQVKDDPEVQPFLEQAQGPGTNAIVCHGPRGTQFV